MSRIEIFGRDDRNDRLSITSAAGSSGLDADALRWLNEHGITYKDFREAAERKAEEKQTERRCRKMEEHFAEFNRLQREAAAYEKRRREGPGAVRK